VISNTSKVGHFTLDNAGNNGTAMEDLGTLLHEHDIEFDAEDRRVMCFEHIVNLSSGQVITRLTKVLADSVNEWVMPPPPNAFGNQSYSDAVECDPVALGHGVV
jgi:hypothetical protein